MGMSRERPRLKITRPPILTDRLNLRWRLRVTAPHRYEKFQSIREVYPNPFEGENLSMADILSCFNFARGGA